ncbi:MAG TPA: hypothetical protein O0X86_01330, partial [Methanocorpusculum sp.]|nr:hypothetical protein [Methanocorpusculum sp.]
MAGKKTSSAPSSEKKIRTEAPPAWVAERKSAIVAAKREHESDRKLRSGKTEPERKLRREHDGGTTEVKA